jgi:hypothetical protein
MQVALSVAVDDVLQTLGLAASPPLASASTDAVAAAAATAAASPGLINRFFRTVHSPSKSAGNHQHHGGAAGVHR